MPIPWGCDVNHVEIELIQVLEIRIALAEAGGLWLPRIGDCLLCLRHFFGDQVADCFDLYFVYRLAGPSAGWFRVRQPR